MGHSRLATDLTNLEYVLDKLRKRLAGGPPDSAGVIEACLHLRRLGCGALLIDLDPQGFARQLARSGWAYARLVAAHRLTPVDEYYLASGFAEPLLDALACGHLDLAREIVALRPARPMPEQGEYEEDYLYYALLGRLVVDPVADDTSEASTLAALEAAVGGEPFPRLDAVRGLLARDTGALTAGLASLAEAWRAASARRKKHDRLDPYDARTTAQVLVEGVAWVRLAIQRGMPVAREYDGVPDVALRPVAPVPDDGHVTWAARA